MSKIDESRIKQLKTIKEYHTTIIAGINFYIDKVYDLKDAYFNDDIQTYADPHRGRQGLYCGNSALRNQHEGSGMVCLCRKGESAGS